LEDNAPVARLAARQGSVPDDPADRKNQMAAPKREPPSFSE
jgi:hypothetical protein